MLLDLYFHHKEPFFSGGWTQSQARRRTKKELYAERVRLGILPPKVVKAAKKIAEVIEEPVYKADFDYIKTIMLEELKVTEWMPDYSRAIDIAMKIKEIEQDDEEVLLLI